MADILIKAGCYIAIILLGIVLRRVGFFKKEDFNVLAKIVIRITLPAAIIVSTAGRQISISMLSIVAIALGGGVSHAGAFLLDAVRAKLPEMVFYKDMPYARIELAQLSNDAGIIGAAMLGK